MAALNEIVQLAAIEALESAENLPQRCRLLPREPFDELQEHQFVKLYCLTKEAASNLIDTLQPHMQVPSRLSDLSRERKVLTALRFFGSGSYQSDIGYHINHAVSQASVSKCIEEVSRALNLPGIFNRYVHLPENNQELTRVRNSFYEKHNFPGVAGCVDCTHIAIYPPHINHDMYNEAIYVNWKGYHSINVQLMCDVNLKTLNVNARFPGSTNDSFIWNNSNALEYMRNIHRNGHTSFYLLGDSGYALRPWMMIPVPDAAPGSPEKRFNERHRSIRSTIGICNGVLKLRFRCLLKHRTLHYKPEKCSYIINACTVLHNICIDHNIPPVELNNLPKKFTPCLIIVYSR
ncbi:hypothetical protein NQ314_012498 [Rhamnusium bicolor]|uniref:DDE Tnp4 domain-containing protein n=1 Tax=Rhamnusium bicolor TaxID=1586634 RepID=A0AAV8XAT0_9CUCU|nr:hypothetical protein NQ314_012498 [Rhamnusium bicolor]